MALLNWIDTLFFGVRRIFAGGVELPERPALNFVGAVCTDNPAENRIDVTFVSSAVATISDVIDVSYPATQTEPYQASPRELVRVDAQDPVFVRLPSAVGNAGVEVLVQEVVGNQELITVQAPSGQTVDGAASFAFGGVSYAKARFVSDGANW